MRKIFHNHDSACLFFVLKIHLAGEKKIAIITIFYFKHFEFGVGNKIHNLPIKFCSIMAAKKDINWPRSEKY